MLNTMKKLVFIFHLILSSVTILAQQKVYTLDDWNIKDWDSQKGELYLDVNEYKLDYNHPLPFHDMQSKWRVKADLKCGTLGTEQVFVCKDGKGSHLLGRLSLHGDISIGYDNTNHTFFVEVVDRNEQPHRLCGGPEVQAGRWYTVEANAEYDERNDLSTLTLDVDGNKSVLTYPGKALRHNASLWTIGHGFPGGFLIPSKFVMVQSVILRSAANLCLA